MSKNFSSVDHDGVGTNNRLKAMSPYPVGMSIDVFSVSTVYSLP